MRFGANTGSESGSDVYHRQVLFITYRGLLILLKLLVAAPYTFAPHGSRLQVSIFSICMRGAYAASHSAGPRDDVFAASSILRDQVLKTP